MGRPSGNRWIRISALVIVVLLAASLLVGIQTSQAKRWVFGSGFTVEDMDVSRGGDFFVTSSQAAPLAGAAMTGANADTTVLHFFRGERISWNATVPAPVSALALAETGSLVAAGLADGGIRLFSGRGADLGSLGAQGPVADLAISSDGGLIAVAAPADRQLGVPGGLLLYRLGDPVPRLMVPKNDMAAVAMSDDGDVLAAVAKSVGATRFTLYDRAVSTARPELVETFPGTFIGLDVSADGRHILLGTERAVFLLARGHARPVGMVPELPDSDPIFGGVQLARDGQSYLTISHDGQQAALYKWGEDEPRWTRHANGGFLDARLDGNGKRSVLVGQDGDVSVLSVTTGRPMKEFSLAGDPRSMAISSDGRYVLASDADGRLYRAPSGYAGLLGFMPDPIVSTLYAQPPLFLWLGVLVALTAVSYPVAMPIVRRARPRPIAKASDAPPAAGPEGIWPTRRLEGPIQVHGLAVRRQGRLLLSDVSFSAQPATLTAVVGGSGEGKSTLLRALLGHGVKAGSVRLSDIDPRKDVRRLRDEVGFVAQALQVYESLTPVENLMAFGGQFQTGDAALRAQARRLLHLVGLDPDTQRSVGTMSGGEQRRVSIAATLLHAPRLLILDEPTTGLDPLTRRRLWHMLADLRERLGVTIIVSTHYLEEAEEADNVVLLEDGRALAHGSPGRVVATAPGGPDLWRVRIIDPHERRATALHDALCLAVADHDAHRVIRDLRVDDRQATFRIRDAPAGAAEALRVLRRGGFEIDHAHWVPMSFEDAFVAHISEARRDDKGTRSSPSAAA